MDLKRSAKLGSWTTAHRKPWRFCVFLVSLYWFLQHLCCSRRAYGPFFKFVFSHFSFFLCLFFFGGGGGGFGGGDNVLSRAFYLTPFC